MRKVFEGIANVKHDFDNKGAEGRRRLFLFSADAPMYATATRWEEGNDEGIMVCIQLDTFFHADQLINTFTWKYNPEMFSKEDVWLDICEFFGNYTEDMPDWFADEFLKGFSFAE